MNLYTLQVKVLIPHWCEEWLILWWPHVGIFQLPLEISGGFFLLFFCILYIYTIFFVKVNGTRKHLGLIPIFWSQLLWGQGGNILFESPCVHLPLEWLEPPQWQNYGIVQEWLLGTQTGSLASPYWSHFSMTPPYLLLKQALSNKQSTSKNRSYYFSSLLDKVFPRLNWGPMPQEWDSN